MQYLLTIGLFVLLVSCSCTDNDGLIGNTNESSVLEQNKDTLYSDEVLREYKGELEDYQSNIELIYSDEKNRITEGLRGDSPNNLQVLYYSQKFPKLNENYKIHLYPVTQNFKYRRITRNKFELQINHEADSIAFDIYVSCRNIVFKYAQFDKDHNLTYVSNDEIGLSRFYEPIYQR
jgi:hypothetical protein